MVLSFVVKCETRLKNKSEINDPAYFVGSKFYNKVYSISQSLQNHTHSFKFCLRKVLGLMS